MDYDKVFGHEKLEAIPEKSLTAEQNDHSSQGTLI
jgi:hypothetical protein